MKNHWRKQHCEWAETTALTKGRPSRIQQRRNRERMKDGSTMVCCQRLFIQGDGAQFFEVRTTARGPEPSSTNDDDAWAQLGSQMAERRARIEQRAVSIIGDGERDEVNPWLERTGWLSYLVTLERSALLASIEQPNADPKKDEEPVETAIWNAMDRLARRSQDSVIKRTGVFVRLEAIRTEKHQTRHQPLQPYIDEDSIVQQARPWKQILMFFART
jgi:hypothetical protein